MKMDLKAVAAQKKITRKTGNYLADHGGVVSRTALLIGLNISTADLTDVLTDLKERGLVETMLVHGTGRPAEMVYLTDKGKDKYDFIDVTRPGSF